MKKNRNLHLLTQSMLKKIYMLRRFIFRMALPALLVFLSGCIKPGSDEVLVTPYTKMDFPAEGETSSFAISSNFLWTIEISDTWITINPMRGYGDRTIAVTAAPNTKLTGRQATFTISGEKAVREITVTQEGEAPHLSLDSTRKTVVAAGDTVSVAVTTNLDISVTPDVPWITYPETRTVETNRYVFSVEPNTALQERQGSVLFKQKDGTLSAVLHIVQNAEAPAIELDTKEIIATSEGGMYKVTVVSNIPWQAASKSSWISIVETKLMQPSECTFLVEPNRRVEERTGYLAISSAEYPQLGTTTVSVVQQGAPAQATLTPEILQDIPAKGGRYTVGVEANFNWQADLSQTEDWILHVEQTASGLIIEVGENEKVESRSTFLQITNQDKSYRKTLVIQQLAGERSLILSPQETIRKMEAEGGTLAVRVYSNVAWKAYVSENWLDILSGSGEGSGVVTVRVNPNEEITSRQAVLTVVTTDSLEVPLNVSRIIKQDGATPFITAQTDTIKVPYEGGDFEVNVMANVPWDVVARPPWVENVLKSQIDKFNTTLFFTVQPNRQTSSRTSRIELKSTDSPVLRAGFVIQQEPEPVFVHAKLNAPDVLHNRGDTFTLEVEANTPTEYKLNVSWIVQKSVETEDRTTTWTFQVLPVPTVSSRQAILQVRKAGTDQVVKSFDLVQRGARIAERDSTALVTFYNNMDGKNWRDTYLWNLQLPVDQWPGIVLETAVRNGERYVKKITLSNARLKGAIGDGTEKDPLHVLSYLEELNLSHNDQITGWLPVSWKDLNNLEMMDLQNCTIGNYLLFGHNIPLQYGTGLRSLKKLVLKNNVLNGEIPLLLLNHPYFTLWNFEENIRPQKGSNELKLPATD